VPLPENVRPYAIALREPHDVNVISRRFPRLRMSVDFRLNSLPLALDVADLIPETLHYTGPLEWGAEENA
jgi:hypothetical protein